MLQVIQSYRTGEVALREVPVPLCTSKAILVRNHSSLISIGTEKATIQLGQKSLLGKGIARPDLIRRALDKAKKEGLFKTWQEAMGRLDVPTPLGYSCAGTVVECGTAATRFSPGDRVACLGQGFASHAEYVSIPVNLAYPIPSGVSEEEAAFAMLGIISLHGIRSANLTFGSRVVVIGLGLLGLLTVQLLCAYGCDVMVIDLDVEKVRLANKYGAIGESANFDDLLKTVESRTNYMGVDAVIITAASNNKDPVDQAIKLSRKRGKIVIVGNADIHPNRNELWQKEVELVVSKAAGPGSLDPVYEIDGVDLPASEVRWTENRNLQEFLRLLSEKKIDVKSLITHRFLIENAEEAYSGLMQGRLQAPIGVLLQYTGNKKIQRMLPQISWSRKSNLSQRGGISVGVIGAGIFAKALLLPELMRCRNIKLHTLVSSSGANVQHASQKFRFENQSTDASQIWANPDIEAVIGLTPHSTHAELVRFAINSGKPLFLEKPLCISPKELAELSDILCFDDNLIDVEADQLNPRLNLPLIMVGHNRRFSKHFSKMSAWLTRRKAPLVMQMRINSGYVSAEHWVHSDEQGRSRIVGEMSHFIDLFSALVKAPIVRLHAERISGDDCYSINNDNIVTSLKFADGSVGSLLYTASGQKAYSREFLEIFFDGNTITSKDFRVTELHKDGKVESYKTRHQEMGYAEELKHFFNCVSGREEPSVLPKEMLHTMAVIFAIEESLATGTAIEL